MKISFTYSVHLLTGLGTPLPPDSALFTQILSMLGNTESQVLIIFWFNAELSDIYLQIGQRLCPNLE